MRGILSIVVALAFLPILHAQETNVQLKDSRAAYSPGSYYISNVVDDRRDGGHIGTANNSGLVMGNGAASAIAQYINSNVKQSKDRQPIIMHIQKLDFDFKKKGSYWHLDCTAEFAFYAGDKMLIEYTGGGKGEVNGGPAEYAESFIRQTLETDMRKFDGWWQQNSDKVPTASTVKVNFTIAKSIDEPNLIVYSSRRPLRVDDFEGGTGGHNPSEMAATFSGNKYAYRIGTEKGQLVVGYTITPYFNISKSWFKQSDHNANVLAHEQLHFDITALKTCELVNKMRNTTFTKDNYQELLEKFSDDVSRQTNDMQELYDAETDHGIIEPKQKEWETKVKKALSDANCY